MCTTCGCGEAGLADAHGHEHPHEHDHGHGPEGRTMRIEERILAANDRDAEANRAWLEQRGAVAWNVMSAPGSGKTALLERTIREIGGEIPIAVIEGDQATGHDAERVRAAGAPVVQINTGRGCHLDATMVADALRELDPPPGARVLIENVGNLVCPSLFALGEAVRVALVSVPEGDDKPIKYPDMFRAADVLVVSKIDLLPHVRFDVERCVGWAQGVNPRLRVVLLSAETGEGMAGWYELLRSSAL